MIKTEFLSRVSHELRTPLNSILGFGQILLLDNHINAEKKIQLNRILDSGKLLLKIVNELLELSSIESGKLQINFSKIEIGRCLDDTINLLEPLSSRHNVSVDLTTGDCISTEILADPSRLLEVFMNIVSNGIKYSECGSTLRINCMNNASDEIIISFKDSGPGIPEDKMDDIFEPFYRIPENNHTIEGTGLGLAITKNLVSLMNGEIGCRNNYPEKGCEFWLKFKKA